MISLVWLLFFAKNYIMTKFVYCVCAIIVFVLCSCKKDISSYGVYVYTENSMVDITYTNHGMTTVERIQGCYINTNIKTNSDNNVVCIKRIDNCRDTIVIFPDDVFSHEIVLDDISCDIREFYQADIANYTNAYDTIQKQVPTLILMLPDENEKSFSCVLNSIKY